jgi:hypothetical protein
MHEPETPADNGASHAARLTLHQRDEGLDVLPHVHRDEQRGR